MTLHLLARLSGAFVLCAGLAGCIDATVDVEVTSPTEARATMTQVMGPDVYSMVKMGAAQAEAGTEGDAEFCTEAGATLTETPDGGATCETVKEGPFETIAADPEGQESLRFTEVAPGRIRVAFPTSSLKGEIGAGDALDEETKQMMLAVFEGHNVTMRVHGGKIIETNMTLSADSKSAEHAIPFVDLISGTADLPDDLYAVVELE